MNATASSKPSLPRHPPPFTPIQECEREELESDDHQPPPPTPQKPPKNSDSGGVSCNKCRPSSRERIVVPVDGAGRHSSSSSVAASPSGLLKSILSTITRKSPTPSPSPAPSPATEEERWRTSAAELSRKLVQANRKRDEAVLESSRLKHSIIELEKKLDRLENYCLELKSGLDSCHVISPKLVEHHDRAIENFLISVSDSRSSVRTLSRSLTLQLRQIGPKIYDRISLLLQPYDIKISVSKNPRALVFYLEALLNKAFFEDFESVGFQKSSSNPTLNPIERCEFNYKLFNQLKDLAWEEVLTKGTRHFSEDFSKFCDRKMSEIVAMLGWNRAWPEPLLQAFFNGSKSVWLVHLLANSVHPSLPVFRVDKGAKFDPVYMEDMGEAKARKLVPGLVRIMVTPGFYVGDNVVKCKVLCRYHNGFSSDKALTPSPV